MYRPQFVPTLVWGGGSDGVFVMCKLYQILPLTSYSLLRTTGGEYSEEARSCPKGAEEWVEMLVDQMSRAKTLDEARQRAAQVLQAFERAVVENSQVRDGVLGRPDCGGL